MLHSLQRRTNEVVYLHRGTAAARSRDQQRRGGKDAYLKGILGSS